MWNTVLAKQKCTDSWLQLSLVKWNTGFSEKAYKENHYILFQTQMRISFKNIYSKKEMQTTIKIDYLSKCFLLT